MILIETDEVIDGSYIRNLQIASSQICSDYANWGGFSGDFNDYLSKIALLKKRNISYFFTRGNISKEEFLAFCKDQNIKFSHVYYDFVNKDTFIVVEDINDYVQFKLAYSSNIFISKLHSIDI